MTLIERYKAIQEKGEEAYFDADELVDILDYFEEQNDFEQYKHALELGLKLHPEDPDIQVKECKSLVYQEKYQQALEKIKSIHDEDNLDLDLLKLECFYAMGHPDEALEYINKLPIDEGLEEIYESLAPIVSELGRDDEAYKLVLRGITLFPENLVLKEELCYHMEMQGKLQPAMQLCRELIDINPYSADYWYMQGRLQSMQGEYESAIESFDFALTCDDSDVEIKLLRAYCLFMNENYEKAIEAYLELLADKNISEHIKPILAECYMKTDDFEQAYSLFKKLLGEPDIAKELPIYKNYIHCALETERDKDVTTEYLSRMFLAAKEMQYPDQLENTYYLHSKEISQQGNRTVSSDKLSLDFIRNKHHRN